MKNIIQITTINDLDGLRVGDFTFKLITHGSSKRLEIFSNDKFIDAITCYLYINDHIDNYEFGQNTKIKQIVGAEIVFAPYDEIEQGIYTRKVYIK